MITRLVAFAAVMLTIVTGVTIPACAQDTPAYAPHDVPTHAVPYHDWALLPRADTGLVDSTGVRVFKHSDGKIYNHPVGQAQYGLALLNTYRVTGDPWFLDRAQRQAQRLADTHVESRGAWWFPYLFPFAGDPTAVIDPPWYSAMAQGQAVSLFTRLADLDPAWMPAADAAFASLLLEPAADAPWAVHADGDGYLWLQEYPRWPVADSERVLNGHLFALYGVWDYWSRTGSADAAALFDAAAITAARYVPDGFRRAGWASAYSLRGGKPHETYHGIHVNQLLHLHALTGDTLFARLAETLLVDFAVPAQAGTIRFEATGHTAVTFTSAGKVTSRKTVWLTRASGAPADLRRRIATQPGYWYRITAGMFAGMWVQENHGYRAMTRPVADVDYLAARQVTLIPKSYSAYKPGGYVNVTVTEPSTVPVGAIGWFGGRLSVYVTGGPLAGYWLPLGYGGELG